MNSSIRPNLEGVERRGAWNAFRHVLRQTCGYLDNGHLSCDESETEIVVGLPRGRAKMRLSLKEHLIVKTTPCKQEMIRMVRTRRSGYGFELHGALFSGTRLAIALIEELRSLAGKQKRQ